MCDTVYAPVCSVDGVTYGNECEARCAHATVASSGECGTVCRPLACPPIWCEFGYRVDAAGCSTCECNPPPMCPPLCDLYCPYGNVIDARGCEPASATSHRTPCPSHLLRGATHVTRAVARSGECNPPPPSATTCSTSTASSATRRRSRLPTYRIGRCRANCSSDGWSRRVLRLLDARLRPTCARRAPSAAMTAGPLTCAPVARASASSVHATPPAVDLRATSRPPPPPVRLLDSSYCAMGEYCDHTVSGRAVPASAWRARPSATCFGGPVSGGDSDGGVPTRPRWCGSRTHFMNAARGHTARAPCAVSRNGHVTA